MAIGKTISLEEEGIRFATTKDVFYNPAMRFCRSMSSLAVGTIEQDLELVDAFSASGIRGIRYAKENKNVKKLTSLDIEPEAIKVAKKNAKANKIKKFAAIRANISKVAFENVADFLEIDPFGTPSPYLADSVRFFNPKKTAYLSVTATDVAVLCGGKTAACMKNYQAKPLNCTFTHEIGLRIMLRRIVDVAAEFNLGTQSLVSFSDQHYLKTIVKLVRSAELAYESQKKQGHLSFCNICGWRTASRFPPESCQFCNAPLSPHLKNGLDYAGPLYLGELQDKETIRKMTALNKARDYADSEKISHFLSLLDGEIGLPPHYYNMHELCKLNSIQPVPKMVDFLFALQGAGYTAKRTHFSPISVKTDAPFETVLECLKGSK